MALQWAYDLESSPAPFAYRNMFSALFIVGALLLIRFFVNGIRSELSRDGDGRVLGKKFRARLSWPVTAS